MKKLRVVPVEPSESFAKDLRKALKSNKSLQADGISIIPPTAVRATWRVKFNLPGIAFDRSAGRDLAKVNAVFLEARKVRIAHLTASTGSTNYLSHYSLSDALQHYFNNGGMYGRWKKRSRANRERDFAKLSQIASKTKMSCAEFNVATFRQFVNNAGNPTRGRELTSHCRLFVEWGASVGYFSEAQTKLHKLVTWTKPTASNYKPAPTRRQQAKFFNFDATNRPGGEVPTHKQVADYAMKVGEKYLHGEALIYVSALIGTRISETLICTASREIYLLGQGNFVDLSDGVVKAHYQINDDEESDSKLTKGGKVRDVVIPSQNMIPDAYEIELENWLTWRIKAALEEQKRGENPLALLFPSPRGEVWDLGNLDSRVLTPAHKQLGWKMQPTVDANGRVTSKSRFTIHSLRDRFGTTAAEEWKYSELQLLDQGSWEDQQTVRRFYLGTTDDTLNSVRQIHGLKTI